MNFIYLTLFLFFGAHVLSAQNAFAQKTLVYCAEGSPSNFNPAINSDGPSFNASSRTSFNRLVEFKYGSTEIEPGLAESWTISKDGLTYTFQLRKNVQFHSNEFFKPTRPMNADDVIFSFEVQKDANHPFRQKTGNYEYFVSMEMDKLIKEIRRIDDHKVAFHLTRTEAPFLANLAMDFASIMSREYAETLLKNRQEIGVMNTHPIGTGPFAMRSYQKDTLIRYDAHPSYFRGKPRLDKLIFSITPDASVRFQKLKTGECHVIADPSPSDLDLIQKTPQLKLFEKEGMNVGYLAMNTKKKPFDDVRVRRAVHHALNRETYMQAIYLGRASVAKNPIPPTIWGYNNKVKDYEYNVEKAQKLLKEAGLSKGFEVDLWTLPVSRPYNPSGKKMGELMQADLAKIGIKVKLVTYDWPTYLEKSKKGEHTMVQLGWSGDNGDPDNFLFTLLSCAAVTAGSNLAQWCDPAYDKLVTEAKRVTQNKQRTQLYMQAQERFKKEAPWVSLAHAKIYRGTSQKVLNYKIHPFGGEYFYELDLK